MKQIKTVSIIVAIMLMMLALPMGITATAATSIMAAFTICYTKRAKIFCGNCINLPLSLYRQLLSSKPETISAIKKNCSKLYLPMNGALSKPF